MRLCLVWVIETESFYHVPANELLSTRRMKNASLCILRGTSDTGSFSKAVWGCCWRRKPVTHQSKEKIPFQNPLILGHPRQVWYIVPWEAHPRKKSGDEPRHIFARQEGTRYHWIITFKFVLVEIFKIPRKENRDWSSHCSRYVLTDRSLSHSVIYGNFCGEWPIY